MTWSPWFALRRTSAKSFLSLEAINVLLTMWPRLFDRVRGSDGSVNLTNIRKRDWLVGEYVKGRF